MILTIQLGIVLEKKIGNRVEKGETLAYIHTNREEIIKMSKEKLKLAYEISDNEPSKYQEILNIV